MTLIDQLYKQVASISIPHFFITVDISNAAERMPDNIETFLHDKHESILNGVATRKFVYKEGGWRLIFTFFPTNQVVEERYALKNKVSMKAKNH